MYTIWDFPTGYEELVKFLNGSNKRKRLASNTTIEHSELLDWVIICRLFGNPIVQLTASHLLWNTCGYETRTTFQRLNRFIQPEGYRIYMRKGQAHLDCGELPVPTSSANGSYLIPIRSTHIIPQLVI